MLRAGVSDLSFHISTCVRAVVTLTSGQPSPKVLILDLVLGALSWNMLQEALISWPVICDKPN